MSPSLGTSDALIGSDLLSGKGSTSTKDIIMAPKKKPRTSGAKSTTASTLSGLTPLHQACLKSIDEWYDLRHNTETNYTTMHAPPISFGGHFKGIAQRAWADPAGLINKSLMLCKRSGLVDDKCTLDDFGSHYLRVVFTRLIRLLRPHNFPNLSNATIRWPALFSKGPFVKKVTLTSMPYAALSGLIRPYKAL